MPVVHLTSLEIQLDDELKSSRLALSQEDIQTCKALFRAIRAVQFQTMPADWEIPKLPKKIRAAVLKWDAAQDKKWRTDPATVKHQVDEGERLHGLKRSRGNRKGRMTAFDFAARRLGISPNTVANKVGRRQLPRMKPRK